MTEKQPSLRITDLVVTQVWGLNPMTGRSEPGLAVTATISWTDEYGQNTTEEYSGSLMPKGVCAPSTE
jgi:hypothetical protein